MRTLLSHALVGLTATILVGVGWFGTGPTSPPLLGFILCWVGFSCVSWMAVN